MTVRTTRKTVTFKSSFLLGGFDEILPPGSYDVEIDEELLDGLSFQTYRRNLVLIHLPPTPERPGLPRTLAIDPDQLDAALWRDTVSNKTSSQQASIQRPPERSLKTQEANADHRAIDRAEDEGMILYPD